MTDHRHTREPLRMSCADALELMTDHLEDALARADVARMRNHLSACAPCRVYLDQLRCTIRLAAGLRSAAEYRVEPDRMERLIALFRREHDA